jgi:hypothetical protein
MASVRSTPPHKKKKSHLILQLAEDDTSQPQKSMSTADAYRASPAAALCQLRLDGPSSQITEAPSGSKRLDSGPGSLKEAKLPLQAVASSESTKATGAQASIVLRGGLNARLAKIMAKEYSRITNPIPV